MFFLLFWGWGWWSQSTLYKSGGGSTPNQQLAIWPISTINRWLFNLYQPIPINIIQHLLNWYRYKYNICMSMNMNQSKFMYKSSISRSAINTKPRMAIGMKHRRFLVVLGCQRDQWHLVRLAPGWHCLGETHWAQADGRGTLGRWEENDGGRFGRWVDLMNSWVDACLWWLMVVNVVQCWIGVWWWLVFFMGESLRMFGLWASFSTSFPRSRSAMRDADSPHQAWKTKGNRCVPRTPKGAEPKGRTKRILILRPLTFPKGMGNVLGWRSEAQASMSWPARRARTMMMKKDLNAAWPWQLKTAPWSLKVQSQQHAIQVSARKQAIQCKGQGWQRLYCEG